jgi:transposase
MTKANRVRYTLEFKQEAVRLVESGQSIAAAARSLGVVDQTLFNWVKAHREGKLIGARGKAQLSAEQMEISRLRADLYDSWRGDAPDGQYHGNGDNHGIRNRRR